MPFKKGDPRPAGAGRKPGQKALKDFSKLLDNSEFNLKQHIRSAVVAQDVKMVSALAQLWRALAATGHPQAPDAEISDAELLKLLPKPPA